MSSVQGSGRTEHASCVTAVVGVEHVHTEIKHYGLQSKHGKKNLVLSLIYHSAGCWYKIRMMLVEML